MRALLVSRRILLVLLAAGEHVADLLEQVPAGLVLCGCRSPNRLIDYLAFARVSSLLLRLKSQRRSRQLLLRTLHGVQLVDDRRLGSKLI